MMSGRVQARAPETGVRIALGARDPAFEAEPRGAKILPARVRSTLFPDNEADEFPAKARPRVPAPDEDQTDREPPDDDAPALSTRPSRSSAPRLASATTSAPIRAGWIVRQRPSAAPTDRSRSAADANADDPRNGPPAPEDRPARKTTARIRSRRRSSPRSPARRDRPAVAWDPPRSAATTSAPPRSSAVHEPAERPRPRTRTSPRPIAIHARTARRPARSRRTAPVAIDEDARTSGEEADATARRPANVRRGSRAAASRPSDDDPASPADSSETDESAEDNPPPARSTRRPTWRELSIKPEDVPVDEALRRSSGEEVEDDRAP